MWASQVALVVKNPPANAGDIRGEDLIPGLGQLTPVFLPGDSLGQRSLAGYVRGLQGSDTACMQGMCVFV